MGKRRYETLSQRMQRRAEELAARRRVPRQTAAVVVCAVVFVVSFLIGIEFIWR